jgi:hypothetical protein
MEISDIIPANGQPQRIYCDKCNSHTELAYFDFSEVVTGVSISIKGLPVLRCPGCGHEQLPDSSRFVIVRLHEEALKQSSTTVTVTHQKQTDRFGFADVAFLYDSDDYFYLPGLYRSFHIGFLQPVFFKRQVLFKYDNAPGYRVKFASTTYGQIDTEDDYISFGINRYGNVVMWLGDIAKLPANEQHYLRSENIPSDHALGSEFYDGQIERKITQQTRENELFRLRSEFLDKCLTHFGVALGHLEAEVFDLALAFNPPVVDTPKERRHVADTLNKVYIESFDNGALDKVVTNLGAKSPGTGSLKRLQTILQAVAPKDDIAALMSPLYVLYDLRVAYSHLTSGSSSPELVAVTTRLGLAPDASLADLYAKLLDGLISTFVGMAKVV